MLSRKSPLFFTTLPSELRFRILCLLDVSDLLRVQLVNRDLRAFVLHCSGALRKLGRRCLLIEFPRGETIFFSRNVTDGRGRKVEGRQVRFVNGIKFQRGYNDFGVPVRLFLLPNLPSRSLLHVFAMLLRLLFRHFEPRIAASLNLPNFKFLRIASLIPSSVRYLTTPFTSESQLLQLLVRLPQIRHLYLLPPHSLSCAFLVHPAVRRLRRLCLHSLKSEGEQITNVPLNDTILKESQWVNVCIDKSAISAQGLQELLREWAEGKKELHYFRLLFDLAQNVDVGDIIKKLPVEVIDGEDFLKLVRPDGESRTLKWATSVRSGALVFLSLDMEFPVPRFYYDCTYPSE